MLPTDWSAPSTSTLRRLSDGRVRQFWDPDHAIAAALKKTADAGKGQPDCCDRNGVLWDLIAAYAVGSVWRELPPEPALFNGTVVGVAGELESLIAK